jgi:hypothetical protein
MSFRHSNTSQGSDDIHGLKESNTETDRLKFYLNNNFNVVEI